MLAYGNMRALALGLEAVLPSGEIWDGLRTLRKDNTGYDLRDLFIGAEGTLGIITGAVLKLFPRPRGTATAFVGVESPDAALALLAIAQGRAASELTTVRTDAAHRARDGAPLHPRRARSACRRRTPGTCCSRFRRRSRRQRRTRRRRRSSPTASRPATAVDGALAQSLEQAAAFWKMRQSLSEVQKKLGGSIKHDVAVPVMAVPELLAEADAAVTRMIPGARPFPFGHLGDGNIHLNISQPEGDGQASVPRPLGRGQRSGARDRHATSAGRSRPSTASAG